MWDFLVGPVVKMLPIRGDPMLPSVAKKRKKGRRVYVCISYVFNLGYKFELVVTGRI